MWVVGSSRARLDSQALLRLATPAAPAAAAGNQRRREAPLSNLGRRRLCGYKALQATLVSSCIVLRYKSDAGSSPGCVHHLAASQCLARGAIYVGDYKKLKNTQFTISPA